MLTEQHKQFIQKLWTDNFLNFKEAAKECSLRENKKLYIATEFRKTIIDSKGIPFEYSLDTLKAISECKKIKWIIHTPYTKNEFSHIMNRYFVPKGIVYDFYNENPDLMFINSDPRNVNYDVLIDYRTGFKGENAWFWVRAIVECLNRMLPESNSVVSSPNPFDTDQFKVGTGEIKVAKPLTGKMRVYNDKIGIWEDKY